MERAPNSKKAQRTKIGVNVFKGRITGVLIFSSEGQRSGSGLGLWLLIVDGRVICRHWAVIFSGTVL